ncbi:aldo/keto reductase-like protein [Bimuria novae-zelandiae CBS 107.79]|uniref:Aldo/keto reductase-like protein n=1 Tax=Bimuria novae-zelandiae CBS 107.79 TaxID=1447943 RepID=A0A6A5VD08_9PLEO|nr:aldo/keto reductase-like protein [Bimuria novae-zelandiae CBS 107.79]
MVKLLGKEVGQVGYGLMGLTWRADPPPQDQAFAAMRAALQNGATFWNGGELYGTPSRNSLQLLAEYFTAHPSNADKVVLSIKGGCIPGTMAQTDGSPANVRRSIDECLRVLDGRKFLDLFEVARIDPKVPAEESIGVIAEYVKAGKVGGISLSEVNANTIRKIHAIHPISAVEVEFSLWSTDILENGVAKTCGELGIPIVAYSPLGRGFLTGQFQKFEDIPETSMLRHMPRFQPDVFDENIKLLREVEKIAKQKNATPGQVALGWVIAHSGKNGYAEILPIPGATTEARVKENTAPLKLSDDDMAVISDILKKFPVQGHRYPEALRGHLEQ